MHQLLHMHIISDVLLVAINTSVCSGINGYETSRCMCA